MSHTKKFKMTDLGPIPEDWVVRTLGEIGDPLMCKRILKSQTKECGDVPFYKIGTFGDKPDAYIDRRVFEYFRNHYYYPRKGDILLSAAGTIGRVVVFDGKDSYFQDSNIVWIRNDESKVLNEYLKLCYQTTDWQTEDGGSVSRLYNDNLKSTKIKYPVDVTEQHRIAAALSDADELIVALTELLEKKRNLKQGAMQQLLTGKRRLPGFKGKWVEKTLEDVAVFETKTVPVKSFNAQDYVSTENMLQNKAGILPNCEEIPYANVREYRTGDSLVSNIRPYLKKIWFATHNGGCSTDVHVVRVRNEADCLPRYLNLILSQDSFFDFAMETATGTKMPRGDKRRIVTYSFLLPLLEDEQRAIAEVLTDMDDEIAGIEAELEKAKNVKTGMMQQLLTGKVRLEVA